MRPVHPAASGVIVPAMSEEAISLSRFGRCDVELNNSGVIEVGPIETIDVERVFPALTGPSLLSARAGT